MYIGQGSGSLENTKLSKIQWQALIVLPRIVTSTASLFFFFLASSQDPSPSSALGRLAFFEIRNAGSDVAIWYPRLS